MSTDYESLWARAVELSREVSRLRKALEEIRDELGVPQPGYAAPVANAAHIARAALGEQD